MEDNLKAQYLIANVDTKAKIRYENFEDVEHLVVPVIAAQQGVMNNLFYPAEEFRDWVETWNGVPVPISHPMVNGIAVSAKTPRIQELTSVGWFFNVEFTKDNKLKGEIWINTDKVKKLNAEYILDRFTNNEIMEVSTGLYSNVEMVSGEYNGKKYDAIVRNIRPDHLALLPNEIGACSVEDGCGAMRNNNKECACHEIKVKQEEKCSCQNENKITSNDIEVTGDVAQEVDQKDQDENSIVSNEQNGGGKMGFIKSLVQNVIANKENEFTNEDSEKLESLGEEVLSKIATNEEEAPAEEAKEAPASEEKAEEQSEAEEKQEEASEESEEVVSENEDEEEVKVDETTEQKANSLIEKIEDVELKELLSNAYKQYEERKATLVNSIVKKSKLTSDEVSVMSINQIERLEQSLKEFSFNGRGASLVKKKEEYKAPSIFDKKEYK
jgi:hypothetical protein